MRPLRLIFATATVAAIAAVLVSVASAIRFADQPCPEAGPGGIRVCPSAVVGTSYAVKLDGAGGCGPDPNIPGSGLPYQFRLLSGSPAPGLSIQKNGVLSGTPEQAGSWSFWVELSDQDPPSASWCAPKKSEREFLVRVSPPPAIVGTPYSVPIGAVGEGQQTWSLATGGLPPGLSLDAASGVISGTPTTSGAFSFRLAALDGKQHTAAVDLTIVVRPVFSFLPTRLAPVLLGHAYRARVRTEGGVGAVLLKVVSGRFPIGLRLNAKSGVVAGRPRKTGVFRLRIEARDSAGHTATGTFVLTVRRK